MSKKIWFLFLISFMIFLSCDLLRDSPYVVEAWTPGEGFQDIPGKVIVSLFLSNDSDRVKTEQAFSLTEDRKAVKGIFFWEGRRLVFVPAAPVEPGRDYFITLGTGAQDSRGISLEKKFEASFTTRLPGRMPKVIGVEPGYGDIISESRGIFSIMFSEPVLLNSCLDCISFSPSASGSWRLANDNKTASFTPADPWKTGITYQARVDGGFSGASGYTLGSDYITVFSTGTDREKPVLLKAHAVTPGNGPRGSFKDEDSIEEINIGKPGTDLPAGYEAWESFTRLELIFSKPMDLSLIKNFLITEPSVPLLLCSSPEIRDRAVFCFSEYPAWGSSFLFRLLPGVKDYAGNETAEEYCFTISCEGPYSKPPALAGIRIPLSPCPDGVPDLAELLSFSVNETFSDLPIDKENFDYNVKTPWWIELYFDTARDTNIDIFSVMDLFRLESTNNALVFSPQSIITENFTRPDPRAGWEHYYRVEIRGVLTNTVQSGIVTFRIPAGLKDKQGNRSSEDFRISLLK